MCKLARQLDMIDQAHKAFLEGDVERGIKMTRFLVQKAILKQTDEDLYALYESSVIGVIGGCEQLVYVMLDLKMLPGLIGKALNGKLAIVPELMAAIGRLDEDTQYEVLTAAKNWKQ